MAGNLRCFALSLLLLSVALGSVEAQFFAPPYFNIAEGRTITATSTCGVGVTDPELYCKLTGANRGGQRIFAADLSSNGDDALIFQGQLCDYCVNEGNSIAKPEQYHPPKYAIDGTERWWQSPPISRGKQYNEVNLTLDLGQEFHVAYVFIKMANSPRPGLWVLERSVDRGATWKPWQYFADSPSDCYNSFGVTAGNTVVRDDDVLCTTEYSKVVPLEGGEIVVSLVTGRPSAKNFSDSPILQDFTKATNVRMRLLRTKTLLGHLMAVARQDPTVTRRYFYSIKDISIGGRCVCNGHADVCDKRDPFNQAKLICDCKHNTCGDQCERCCPGFVQKKWRKATMTSINACEPCNCFKHATECLYDEGVDERGESLDIHGNYDGGGVCQNCQHNTEGINCQRCKFGYYRPRGVALDSPNVCQECQCDINFSTGDCEDETGQCQCQPEYAGPNCDQCNVGFYGYPDCRPCDCNYNGTLGGVCQVGGGQCPCKPGFGGLNCDRCEPGRYNFPECTPCACDSVGAFSSVCDPINGQCTCGTNFGGRDCSQCEDGHYSYPNCDYCGCDPTGSVPEVCDKFTGRCLCKPNFAGGLCDRCSVGFYNYPSCIPCECSSPGSRDNNCQQNGQCVCLPSFGGTLCDRCAPGHYRYPDCLPCNCDTFGSRGVTCNQQTGQCVCFPNFQGPKCNKCAEDFYNYPVCEECNCNPAGAKEIPGYKLGGCGSHSDGTLCMCKERVEGHICDVCKKGYFNLDRNNPLGCDECNCDPAGVLAGDLVCNPASGQCQCKPKVEGRRCDECVDGTFRLSGDNVFGCQDCNCNVGGSVSATCDKQTGQCRCRPRITGVGCDRPILNHYFPTLFQHKYELEDGHTPQGTRVRYGFDESYFPGFSWKGFAVFSRIQPEVIVDVDISKPSLFRLIYRYVNQNPAAVTAEVKVKPETSTDVEQTSTVVFQPTRDPMFAAVSGGAGVSTFVLNPGKWMISLRTDEKVFVDYVVLLPQAYYEATILQEDVDIPCSVYPNKQICIHHVLADISVYPTVRADVSYVIQGGNRANPDLYKNRDVLKALGDPDLVTIDGTQDTVYFDLRLPPGKYILLANYFNQLPRTQTLDVDIGTQDRNYKGDLVLQECQYSYLCRQIVTDGSSIPLEVDSTGRYIRITLKGDSQTNVQIESITAIPVADFTIDFLKPRPKCIRRDGKCIETSYPTPVGTLKTEFEVGPNEIRKEPLPGGIDVNVGLVRLDKVQPRVTVDVHISEANKPYVFTVQYYNPNMTSFDVNVEVVVDGKVYKGVLKVEFCPNIAGCRGVVKFDGQVNPNVLDIPTQDIQITLETPGKDLWVDYILVIPETAFTGVDVTTNLPVDRSGDFIKDCAKEFYNISPNDPSVSEFCRKSIFTLTTEYSNGALQCQCNTEGSTSFLCNEFGGQCRCKPNVIGRTCSECRTGYFGFPNCRRCNCPAGFCDPVSGQCLCPPKVTGPECNICLPQTFGYDALIGCEDCACNTRGTVAGNEDCDVTTGQCTCRPLVAGRQCDSCVAGAHSFPDCQRCVCDTRGTTKDICNAQTAQCLCKPNTEGPQCDICQQGSFYLEDRNPLGCTSCFCFGTTKTCDSSNFRRETHQDMSGWTLMNAFSPSIREGGNVVAADVRSGTDSDGAVLYWVAPSSYLGNRITSYGGKLTYTIVFTLPPGGISKAVPAMDVRLGGNNFTLVHQGTVQPNPSQPFTNQVDLIESQFVHDTTGASVSREQFMMTLVDLEFIHIRASYHDLFAQVRISDVILDAASLNGAGDVALNVEQCLCPRNYKGSSCEECADGYYRLKSGPYLGVCTPCECNGHADTCDPETGECIACRDGTKGHKCDECLPGYYGDATTGVCNICECPIAAPGNNFASGCTVVGGQVIQCDCLPGYSGAFCDECSVGFWGDPLRIGEKCQPCQCNGNAVSCSDLGECVDCANNTAGFNCERCAEWYYGDAINRKDCEECLCDKVGSDFCNQQTGQCVCKRNVVGPLCDQCAPGTYGFNSGQGCYDCDCASAALSPNCDLATGQCQCQPGTTGRRCDQCLNGYFNYGPGGCQKCDCAEEGATTCDPVTGRCQCLQGVTGDKCDMCEDRWVLIPEQGCRQCDSCIHLLLDDIEKLQPGIIDAIENLLEVSISKETYDRLQKINTTLFTLKPQVDSLLTSVQPIKILPLTNELKDTQNYAREVQRKSEEALHESEVLLQEIDTVKQMTTEVDGNLKTAGQLVNKTVQFISGILNNIQSRAQVLDRDVLIEKARQLYNELERRDFTGQEGVNKQELQDSLDLLRRVKELRAQAHDHENRTREIQQQVTDVADKLRDIKVHAEKSIQLSNSSLSEVEKTLDHPILQTIEDAKTLGAQVQALVDMAKRLVSNATQNLEDAKKAYEETEYETSRLDAAMETLIKAVNERQTSNNDVRPLVEQAKEHAKQLSQRANQLENLIRDTQDAADGALRAAGAYETIVTSIGEALNASEDAIKAADDAIDKSNGIGSSSTDSKERSEALKEEAEKLQTDKLKTRLDDDNEALNRLSDINKETNVLLKKNKESLDNLPQSNLNQKAKDAADKAMIAQNKATDAKNKVQDIVNQLPSDQERVKQIEDEVTATKRDMKRIQSSVDEVNSQIPNTIDLLDKLQIRNKNIEDRSTKVKGDLDELKRLITAARNAANRIAVGMHFFPNTTLQVRNPEKIGATGGRSKFSLYFKTEVDNGLLVYVGPDQARTGQSDDYFSLEIRDGHVVFQFDLGSGPTKISTESIKDFTVNDGKWHEVIAERDGKRGKLVVRTEDEDDIVVEGDSPGRFSILNLSKDTAKVFIGGVPSGVNLPREILERSFAGCIEDVKLNDGPIGLWDFVQGTNNNMGCVQRETLRPPPPPESIKLDGDNSYLVMPVLAGEFQIETNIQLGFKTLTEDASLVFLQGDEGYLAVELKDGKVAAATQGSSANRESRVELEDLYNDNEWHQVSVYRSTDFLYLKVDDKSVELNINDAPLDHNDNLYFGGIGKTINFPGLVSKSFTGCLRNVQVAQNPQNLNLNSKEAVGTIPGCSADENKEVYMSADEPAYVAMPAVNVKSKFEMTLKMRTTNDTGLIFHVANAKQTHALSLALVNGRIVCTALNAGPEPIRVETVGRNYNDGLWHYITLNKKGQLYSLSIDDEDNVFLTATSGKKKLNTDSKLFFGGVPADYNLKPDVAGTAQFFDGCMGEVTVNSKPQDFASVPPNDRVGVSFTKCPLVDPVVTTIAPTTRSPSLPEPIKATSDPLPATEGAEQPSDECALPLNPVVPSVSDTEETALRFGTSSDSRAEFDSFTSGYSKSSEFSIEFKTSALDGLIFYMGGSRDMQALYMSGGLVHYIFNPGSGPGQVVSTGEYSDGEWHQVIFKRRNRQGELIIDGTRIGSKRSKGSSRSIEAKPPFYLGGLGGMDAAKLENLKKQLGTGAMNFKGCLRNFKLNMEHLKPSRTHELSKCTDSVEMGTFFSKEPGYLILEDNFRVGRDIEITFEMRPRVKSGVLFAVMNPGSDYLIIQLVDGQLIAGARNGNKDLKSIYAPAKSFLAELCDGRWHSVKVIKAKNTLFLEVNNKQVAPGVGDINVSSTDTNHPLYIGGVPANFDPSGHATMTRDKYVGCLRNLKINNKMRHLESSQVVGTVDLQTCPTT